MAMRIQKSQSQIQMFSATLAAQYGLKQAIVYQELIQSECRRCVPAPENGVIEESGEFWYRYAPEELAAMFPYLSFAGIQAAIRVLKELGWINVRCGKSTDFLWINIP